MEIFLVLNMVLRPVYFTLNRRSPIPLDNADGAWIWLLTRV